MYTCLLVEHLSGLGTGGEKGSDLTSSVQMSPFSVFLVEKVVTVVIPTKERFRSFKPFLLPVEFKLNHFGSLSVCINRIRHDVVSFHTNEGKKLLLRSVVKRVFRIENVIHTHT